MYVSYNKLWKLLIDKNLKKKDLCEKCKISTASISKMTRGDNITTDVLLKICNELDCDFGDIMEFCKDEKKEEKKTTEDNSDGK